MFADDEEEGDATSMALIGNQHYDLNNVPGDIKRALIEQDKVNPGKFFIAPAGIDKDNCPGEILVPLRAAHAKRMQKLAKTNGNPFSIGDQVVFQKKSRQVVAISSKKPELVKLTNKSGEISKWIHYSKIKALSENEEA